MKNYHPLEFNLTPALGRAAVLYEHAICVCLHCNEVLYYHQGTLGLVVVLCTIVIYPLHVKMWKGRLASQTAFTEF